MVDLAEEIAHADEQKIEQLLKAVLQRYAVLFPDYEETRLKTMEKEIVLDL